MDKKGEDESSQRQGQKRKSSRATKVQKKYKVEDRWTLLERTRLLEALKRYDVCNITNISTLIGTKSEEEVEEKIQELKGVNSTKGSSDRVGASSGPSSKKSPIEAWIDLVQEMTKHDNADYSQFITKIFGLIARNEHFEDSGFSQLKWRNIYQFLADICEDRVEVQKLSDLESLVILDLMHSLGDTLHNSDTSEQRRILDFKYHLLNFKSDNPSKNEREINTYRVAQALSNDFWEPEDFPGIVPVDPGPSTATSSLGHTEHPQSQTMTEMGHGHPSSSISSATTSESSQQLKTASSNSVTGVMGSESQGTSRQASGYNQTDLQEPNSGENDSADVKREEGSGVELINSSRFGKKFERPKYFTLNPLCVPTQTLAFRPKSSE